MYPANLCDFPHCNEDFLHIQVRSDTRPLEVIQCTVMDSRLWGNRGSDLCSPHCCLSVIIIWASTPSLCHWLTTSVVPATALCGLENYSCSKSQKRVSTSWRRCHGLYFCVLTLKSNERAVYCLLWVSELHPEECGIISIPCYSYLISLNYFVEKITILSVMGGHSEKRKKTFFL